MQIPKELEGWTLDEVLENFDSLLTPETSDLLFQIDKEWNFGRAQGSLLGDAVRWWVRLNPTQQSEIISAYEKFDTENYRFEIDHQ